MFLDHSTQIRGIPSRRLTPPRASSRDVQEPRAYAVPIGRFPPRPADCDKKPSRPQEEPTGLRRTGTAPSESAAESSALNTSLEIKALRRRRTERGQSATECRFSSKLIPAYTGHPSVPASPAGRCPIDHHGEPLLVEKLAMKQ